MDNRIERINGNNYYEYAKIKNIKVSDTGEKFSLDYKNEQLNPETKEKDDKEDSAKETGQSAEQNGVRLEISHNGRMANAGRAPAKTAAGTKGTGSLAGQLPLLESVKEFAAAAIAAVKDFFYKIWNEPSAVDVVQEESASAADKNGARTGAEPAGSDEVSEMVYATPQEAAFARYRNEVLLDHEIQPYLKSGDLDRVISLLTDNGRKTIARNSTLLTYYDRNGKMVEPNASDRERILYGDRNTKKL